MRSGCLAWIGVVLLLSASATSADMISVDGAAIFESSTGSHAGDTLYSSGTVAPFDSSLGTLTGVQLHVVGDGGASLTLTDLLPGRYEWGGFVRLSVFGPQGTVLFTDRQAIDNTFVVDIAEDGTATGAPDTWPPFSISISIGNSYGLFASITDNLELFLTPNSFLATAQFEIPARGPSISETETILAPDISGGGFGVLQRVTYFYTPIPEPSTALLLGLGVAVLTVMRTRVTR
jgi:hypothetical protein